MWSGDENCAYQLSFSMEDGIGILTREDGFPAYFDPEYDMISFPNYDAFLRRNDNRLLIDILNVDEPAPNEDAKYFHRSEGSYELFGKTVTLNLADYGIDLFSDGEDCYVPAQTISDFMLSSYYRSIFYNGEALFLSRFGGLGIAEYPSALGKLVYSVEARQRSEALAKFSYSELCLALDHLYGLKERHGISSFDELTEQFFLRQSGTQCIKEFQSDHADGPYFRRRKLCGASPVHSGRRQFPDLGFSASGLHQERLVL